MDNGEGIFGLSTSLKEKAGDCLVLAWGKLSAFCYVSQVGNFVCDKGERGESLNVLVVFWSMFSTPWLGGVLHGRTFG